jgi:hypothetical protein
MTDTSVSDPDSIQSVDSDLESGTETRAAHMAPKKNFSHAFHVLMSCIFSQEGRWLLRLDPDPGSGFHEMDPKQNLSNFQPNYICLF